MKNNSVIAKIKKLLSLATSDNENEAKVASAMASELLTKHNLDMQEVNYANLEYEEKEVYSGMKKKTEYRFINSILDKYFHVKVVNDYRGMGIRIKMLGETTNLEIAGYMFGYLEHTFKQLFKAYRKETGAPLSARQSYYYGLYKGFCAQMEDAKKKAEASKGLVLAADPGLVKRFKELHPNCKNKNQSVNSSHRGAENAGREDGRNIKIARGISTGHSGETKLLN